MPGPDLGRLTRVRSRLVQDVLAHVQDLSDTLDLTPWMRRGERIRARDVAVEPMVLTRDDRPHSPREQHKDNGPSTAERLSPMDEIEAQQYELPLRANKRKEEWWRQVVRRGRIRLGLRGAPGSGKTFITRHTLAEAARQAAARLDAHEVGLDDTDVPVWVTAKALAALPCAGPEDVLPDALQQSLQLPLSPRVRQWLRRGVVSPRALIVVDALDELLESDRPGFEANARLLDRLPGRVAATSRTMHWDERKGWLGWPRVTEMELAPLAPRQKRQFVQRFFAENAALALNLNRLLQGNFALRQACATPLLLTFGCLLHEEGKVSENTTCAQLYAHMVRQMMSGQWRGLRPPWATDTVVEERCLHMLEGIAWRLFSVAPHQNRFTLAAWENAAHAERRALLSPGDLLGELVRVGFVVPSGFEDNGDRCWSLVHRTFLEFLAARALSRWHEKDWLAEARKHFWFEPEWLEVLSFLAGLVPDATPLVQAVEAEQEDDDLFRSMLCLKARFVGTAARVDAHVLRQTCREVFSFWCSTLDVRQSSLRPWAATSIGLVSASAEARRRLVSRLLKLTSIDASEISDSASAAMDLLGELGDTAAVDNLLVLVHNSLMEQEAAAALCRIGEPRAVDYLLALCKEDTLVRYTVPMVLAEQGDTRAVDVLWDMLAKWTAWDDPSLPSEIRDSLDKMEVVGTLDRLLDLSKHGSEDVRCAAAVALGKIGGTHAIARLMELTNDKDEDVCWAAMDALAQTGDSIALDHLLARSRDVDPTLRRLSAGALAYTLDPRTIDSLVEMARDEHAGVRERVAAALGEVADSRAVDRLLELTRDGSAFVREEAVRQLGRIGGGVPLETLREMLGDTDLGTRLATIGAIGTTGDARAFDALLALTYSRRKGFREAAAEALGRLGDARATRRLVELTKSTGWSMREAAIEALSRVGDSTCVEQIRQLALRAAAHEDIFLNEQAMTAIWRIACRHRIAVR